MRYSNKNWDLSITVLINRSLLLILIFFPLIIFLTDFLSELETKFFPPCRIVFPSHCRRRRGRESILGRKVIYSMLDRVPGCTVDLMSETRNELRDRTVVTRISKVLDAQLVTRTRFCANNRPESRRHSARPYYTIEKLKLPGGQLRDNRNFRV